MLQTLMELLLVDNTLSTLKTFRAFSFSVIVPGVEFNEMVIFVQPYFIGNVGLNRMGLINLNW